MVRAEEGHKTVPRFFYRFCVKYLIFGIKFKSNYSGNLRLNLILDDKKSREEVHSYVTRLLVDIWSFTQEWSVV